MSDSEKNVFPEGKCVVYFMFALLPREARKAFRYNYETKDYLFCLRLSLSTPTTDAKC